MNNAGEKVLMHYSWPGSTSETYLVTYNTVTLDYSGLVSVSTDLLISNPPGVS